MGQPAPAFELPAVSEKEDGEVIKLSDYKFYRCRAGDGKSEKNQLAYKPPVRVNKVDIMAPLGWLSKGVSDLKKAKSLSLTYGLTFAILGAILIFIAAKNPVWSAALTSAFLLLGPFLAIGLYELSRQIEKGKKPSLKDSIHKIRENLVNLVFLPYCSVFY